MYCKLFLVAIIGAIIAAGAPILIGVGFYLFDLPVWSVVVGCIIVAFFNLYATLKYIDKCSNPNSWFWKE
jgi:hypothetical protein